MNVKQLSTGYTDNILQLGGNWNNGSKAGLFYSNLNNDVGNSNRNNGSRLELRMFNGERTFYEQSVYPHRYQVKHTTKKPRQASMLKQYRTSGENVSPLIGGNHETTR